MGGVGRSLPTHRVVWLLAGRTIPDDLVLDHPCRNRRCRNPAQGSRQPGEHPARGDGVGSARPRVVLPAGARVWG
ncbi:HNH endonuclease [Deinococcus aestuarii]|uniref:HNH endonuclease n=1 Tax=Deinococcus aestuarii TaxID=2774531 RepID=UPI001C0A9585